MIFERFLDLLGRGDRCTCDPDAVARDEVVRGWTRPVNELVMAKVFDNQFLVVVSLLLVYIKILTIEVEQAVRKLIARKGSDDQLTVKSIKHAAPRHEAPALLSICVLLNRFFMLVIYLNLSSNSIRILFFGRLGHVCACIGLCLELFSSICVEFLGFSHCYA